MADKGGSRGQAAEPGEAPELLLDKPVGVAGLRENFEPLVTALGGGTLDFSAMLAIADLLPMPVGYIDNQQVFRFINRAGAEWFERPRRDILGHSYAEVVGPDAYAARRPRLEEALGGERKFFAAEYEHPSRGALALQIDYVPWADAGGSCAESSSLPRTSPSSARPSVRSARAKRASGGLPITRRR
jgi:PAS domain-containing protein